MDKLKFLIALSLLLLSLASPPTQAQQAQSIGRCSTDTRILVGGFAVTRCYDGKSVGGIGTTLDDAVANAAAMSGLLSQGVRCVYSSFEAGVGAFIVTFGCSKDGINLGRSSTIGGLGTTLTDAGNNVLGFAMLYGASNGYRCSVDTPQMLPGGYIGKFGCGYPEDGSNRASTINGIGSTATDAGANNLNFAELAATGTKCGTGSANISLQGLAYKVIYSCSGHNLVAYGSSLTAAGHDALIQAQGL
ncbi:MAG TPA: hypothetical protein VM469_08630 [Pseudoxanthomonas sp.]|jgi:hypothetical protein|nr:hypothetical protein [Pseudoxanthomonas sp.]